MPSVRLRGAVPSAVESPTLSGIPGLVHGFERRTQRNGAETREESRARVSAALAPAGRLYLMTQVHGVAVQHAPWSGAPQGDIAVCTSPGIIVGVETADCLPILIVDALGRRAAAVHAGWRGTLAGAARAAIAALVAAGSRPEGLRAALGPAIGACCYEVGPELRDRFGPDADGLFRPGREGRFHLDLREANLRQLVASRVRLDHVAHVDECTFCMPESYCSYRRDGSGSGRMISYVGFVADRG
jgi:hypothetical protein